jgi:hypothetical protein
MDSPDARIHIAHFIGGPDIVPTKDGKWTMLADLVPALRQRAFDLLKPKGGFYEAVHDAATPS